MLGKFFFSTRVSPVMLTVYVSNLLQHRSIAFLVLAWTYGTVLVLADPDPEPEPEPQMMTGNPYARPPYNPYLPGRTAGQMGPPSPCEMTNQCCGFANQVTS